MKFRTGFVSNSSSASFVLHTNFLIEEFKCILQVSLKEYFSEDSFKIELNRLIEENEVLLLSKDNAVKDLKAEGVDQLGLWDLFGKQTGVILEKLKKTLEDLKDKRIDLVDTVFDVYHYSLEENQLGRASVYGHTFMYNDENDLGKLLLAIRNMLEEKYGHNSWMLEVDEDN